MDDAEPLIGLIDGSGFMRFAGRPYRIALGERGIVVHKEEGDRGTPAGLLALRRVYYRADRCPAPVCRVPLEPIARSDGWCDDPTDADYNRPITLPHPARHESLWRDDSLYDVIAVLGWNDAPIVKGRGSAIFLHAARPDYAPTAGCIALAPADLRAVLAQGLGGLKVVVDS